jgi:hypothetical protein
MNQFAELPPIAAIKDLQAAVTLASDHGFGMAIAELDLTHRPGPRRQACGELSSRGFRVRPVSRDRTVAAC